MKSFKEYKKLVESVEYNGWKIELSNVAKYPGEYSINYKYTAYKVREDSKRIKAPLIAKIGVSNSKNIFDDRCQYTKKELIEELKKIDNSIKKNDKKTKTKKH